MRKKFYQQLNLFKEYAPTRYGDPETSFEAARAVVDIRRKQWEVWKVLYDLGPMTDEEMYSHLPEFIRSDGETRKIMTDSSARTRRSELVNKGLVRWNGIWGLSDAGNRSRIWWAVGLPGGGHINWKSMIPQFAKLTRKDKSFTEQMENLTNIAKFGIEFIYYPLIPYIGLRNLRALLPHFKLSQEEPYIPQDSVDILPLVGRRYAFDVWWFLFQIKFYVQLEGPWAN